MLNIPSLRRVLVTSGSSMAVVLALGVSEAAAQAGAPAPAATPLPTESSPPPPADDENEVEAVVVTGVRESLRQAVDVKRNAPQVMDVITAEDVGKLPDDNVAEALQRVTGVQISRVFGEGQSVNIRGLQQVRVEVDGRTLLGWSARLSPPENEQLGRSSGLDTVPSGLFGRLEVRKSPVAAQVEGGLGGSVNLVTPDPLDFKEPTFRYRAQATYSAVSEEIDPSVTFLTAGKFLGGRLGLLLAADYSVRTASTQALERNNFFNTTTDLNGDGARDINGDRLHYEQFTTDRTRYGVTFEAQYRLTDEIELFAETIFSAQENERRQDFFVWRYGPNPVTSPVFQNNYIIAGAGTGAITQAGLFREEPTESYLLAGGGKWSRGPLDVAAEFSFSAGTQEQQIRQITLVSQNNRVPGTFDYRGGDVPVLNLGNFDVTDYANYRVSEVRANTLSGDLEERVGKIDLNYDLNAGPLTRLHAGLRLRELTSSQVALRSTAQVTRTEIQPYLRVLDGGFLPDVAGTFPRRFLTTIADSTYIYDRATGGGPIGRNQARDYNLVETSTAGYVMADFAGQAFGGRDFSANAGVRYVTTDLEVASFLQRASGLVPVKDENSYENWLPSANLKMEITEDLLVRVAAARVLQQAGVRELAPSIFVNESNRTASGGNAGLLPTVSDQFDVSLEYYFGDESLLSGAIFFKDVTDFIAEETVLQTFIGFEQFGPIPYTRPSNIGTAEIRGVEVGVQHFFDGLPAPFDGFGVIANYTYSDATDQNGNPLVAVSKNSYNLIGLYERGRVSGRLAYNYRDEAVFSFTQGRPDFIGEVAQLDAQVSYDLTKRLTVQLQAVNLAPDDSATVEYSALGPLALNSYALSETRYMFGIRGRF